MTTLRELQQTALKAAFSSDYFGQEVTYEGVPIQAIFKYSENPDERRRGSAAVAFLHVKNTDVPVWVNRDTVVIENAAGDEELWYVIKEAQGSTWFKTVLQIERDRRVKP